MKPYFTSQKMTFSEYTSKFVDKKCPLSNAVLSTLGWLLFISQNVTRKVVTYINILYVALDQIYLIT